MSVPFVGRADELGALRTLISGARRGGAPAAGLITGEPGTGKSTLLRESLRGVGPDRTVMVAGYEPTEPIPLAALGDLVRRLDAVPGDGPRLAPLVFGSDEKRFLKPSVMVRLSVVLDFQTFGFPQGYGVLDVAQIQTIEHVGAFADQSRLFRGGHKAGNLGVIRVIA